MKGPPRVGTASATAATVYTENLGEVANTSYGAIASLPIVPDVPSATATTSGPPELGRLVGRAPLSRLGAGVFACARVTRRPAAASPARVSKAKAVEESRRRARRLRMQAVGATGGGGHLGYVGVNYDVKAPGIELFFAGIHTLGGPAPVRVPSRPDPAHLGSDDRPRQGLRPRAAARGGGAGIQGHG